MPNTRASPMASFFGSLQGNAVNFFPNLPPYSDPTTGILSVLPKPWIPYAQLMRLDRPATLYAFYFPYLIGLAYSACVAPETPEPASLLKLAQIFLPFSILLRGAACTWNDITDQYFGPRVARTRHRPLARGAVSTAQASVFALAQLFLLSVFHNKLGPLLPAATARHTAAAAILFAYHAFVRSVVVARGPQVAVLRGAAFAWPVFSAAAALRADPYPYDAPTLALFGAIALWAATCGTIHAYRDVADDARAAPESVALRLRHRTKALARLLSAAQVALLGLCGVWAGFGPSYFVGTVGGVAAAMAYYVSDVDLERPESCDVWFHRQLWMVGAAFMVGFVVEYFSRMGHL